MRAQDVVNNLRCACGSLMQEDVEVGDGIAIAGVADRADGESRDRVFMRDLENRRAFHLII